VYWADDRSQVGLDFCLRILDRLAEELAVPNPHDSFQLNIYLIHAVLNSWNKLFQKFQTVLLPSQILEKLERFLVSAPGLFEPNIATYTIILDGASYCPNPAERIGFTEALLKRLIDESEKNPALRPTAVTIGTVLKGLSKSGSRQAAEKAEGLLRRILDLQNLEQWSDLEVNTIHYTTVLQAYANAGDPESAQRLLMEMLREAVMNGNENVRPNIRSFNAVLSAWSKSSSSDAYEAAEELFRRVAQLYENGVLKEPPNTVCYNCLLTTLAKRTKQVSDPVAKAESLVEDLLQRSALNPKDSSFEPTQVTFTALFRILEASNHPDKNDKTKYWLDTAKKYGIEDGRILPDYNKFQAKPLPDRY
jgi:pentatricopeptide repeat protein